MHFNATGLTTALIVVHFYQATKRLSNVIAIGMEVGTFTVTTLNSSMLLC